MKTLFRIILFTGILFCWACDQHRVLIHSYLLRDRIVVADRVFMRKALYVAFSVPHTGHASGTVQVTGQLFHEREPMARSRTTLVGEKSGNLIFDLSEELPDGQYTIKIDAAGDGNKAPLQGALTVSRKDLKKYQDAGSAVAASDYREVVSPDDTEKANPSDEDNAAGYIISSSSPLQYVLPGSWPKDLERIHSLSVRAVRNEQVTTSISVHPLRTLGTVTISITDLRGTAGSIHRSKISIGRIETVDDTTGLPSGRFRKLPTLIKPGNRTVLEQGDVCRFVLRLEIQPGVRPGVYSGSITISPEYGRSRTLPFRVVVESVLLEDVPNKDYFMLMTYEFTELALPENGGIKDSLYRAAVNVLKDYQKHGMTTLAIHSPFVLLTNEDGSPVLNDIFATLIAARDLGFTRPIIWYMGHLIQTAKPKHPGNITGFEETAHLNRLETLVRTVNEFAKRNRCPEVIYLPIDEFDDAGQDVQGMRRSLAARLVKIIQKANGKAMVTGRGFPMNTRSEYLAVPVVTRDASPLLRPAGTVVWGYDNDVTTRCDNPAYARYVYGYYAWKRSLDGMASWTFQNTQNASGWPTKADSAGRDLYLAYPDPDGPLATLKWEALRDGINDHKLIYQLEKRIAALKEKHLNVSPYERALVLVRERQDAPNCHVGDRTMADAEFFEKTRNDLISLIIDADRRFALQSSSMH